MSRLSHVESGPSCVFRSQGGVQRVPGIRGRVRWGQSSPRDPLPPSQVRYGPSWRLQAQCLRSPAEKVLGSTLGSLGKFAFPQTFGKLASWPPRLGGPRKTLLFVEEGRATGLLTGQNHPFFDGSIPQTRPMGLPYMPTLGWCQRGQWGGIFMWQSHCESDGDVPTNRVTLLQLGSMAWPSVPHICFMEKRLI